MRIGELARRSGASQRALRYYEQQGLLRARRAPNGYRDYDDADLDLVREIRSLLASGFTLEEVRPFVACLREGIRARHACPAAFEQYRRKLAQLDAHLDRVRALREQVAAELARLLAGAGQARDPLPEEAEVRP